MRTVKQVAEELQCSIHTIYRYIEAGKIKAVKLNRNIRIADEEVEKIKKEGIQRFVSERK